MKLKKLASTVTEWVGMGLVVYGCYLISPALAYIASGLLVTALAVLTELSREREVGGRRGAPR